MSKPEEITISMEEYEELLIIKGKYEELKNQKQIFPVAPLEFPTTSPTYPPIQPITYYRSNDPLPEPDIRITCNKKD